MKSKRFLFALTAALTMLLFCACGSAGGSDLSAEEAKEIALEDVGLNANEVNFIRAERDTEFSGKKYEIEFYAGSIEYDYEIDAKTGEILSFDQDAINYNAAASGTDTGTDLADDIGEEQAKTIALTEAGVKEGDTTRFSVHRDMEEGRTVYEVEFYLDKTEYSYEINAADGTILSRDRDND